MPVTATAQSPPDMELSGEGSDVDMIPDDNAKLDYEDEDDPEVDEDEEEEEPEPEEVNL